FVALHEDQRIRNGLLAAPVNQPSGANGHALRPLRSCNPCPNRDRHDHPSAESLHSISSAPPPRTLPAGTRCHPTTNKTVAIRDFSSHRSRPGRDLRRLRSRAIPFAPRAAAAYTVTVFSLAHLSTGGGARGQAILPGDNRRGRDCGAGSFFRGGKTSGIHTSPAAVPV